MDPPDTARSTSPLPPLAPLQNPKYRHISRSAAKRESVQLLGSIKDLQLHFARAGLVEHKPGIGVGFKRSGLGEINEQGDEENTPPVASGSRIRKPYKEVETPRVDSATARREVRGVVARVRNLWGLGMTGSISMVASPSSVSFSDSPQTPSGRRIRGTGVVLIDTAKSIRRVRDLAMAVVRDTGTRRVSGPSTASIKARHRAGFSTPSRPSSGMPRAVSYTHGERSRLGVEETKEDSQAELRKCALEVLAGLRVLEERLRVEYTHQEQDDTRSSRVLSPDMSSSSSGIESGSTRPTSTTFTEPDTYDSEEEYSFNAVAQADAGESTQTWEERIAAEHREYRGLEEEADKVEGVKDGVKRWLAVVETLFGVKEGEVGELEPWAREELEGRDLNRLHAFLLAHLPLDLQILLPQPTSLESQAELLSRLSDGFILAQAYNTAISFSPMAWGFIPPEDIYDTLRPNEDDNEEAKGDKEWTFRRVGNLTCWAAALRLRYNLPIHMPTSSVTLAVPLVLPPRSGSSSVTTPRGPSPVEEIPPRRKNTAPRIDFDPMTIAKKGHGWEKMLEELLIRWVEAAAAEMRGDTRHHERAATS